MSWPPGISCLGEEVTLLIGAITSSKPRFWGESLNLVGKLPCVQGSLAKASALNESECGLQGASLENHYIPTPGLVLLPVRHCLG